MIDAGLLRKDPDLVRAAIKNRGGRYSEELEKLIQADEVHRRLLTEIEGLRAQVNGASKDIGKAKAAKDEAKAKSLLEEAAALKGKMDGMDAELKAAETEKAQIAMGLPNPPHSSVPVGRSEADNKVVRTSGEPEPLGFAPLDHQTIGEKLGILDFAAAAKLSGSRFALWKGAGAKLIRSLISYQLDRHLAAGYQEIWPPLLVRPEILEGTGQLPKFEADLYKTRGDEKAPDLYLIPTAEVPLTNLVRETILQASELPKQFVAYTPCFRQEAGSYGKDVRGLIRNHQFDKVELVWITEPEKSLETLERLTSDAEGVLKSLGLPCRVLELCTADLGFASRKTYDLEVWMPSESRYREISSCSDCGDFQARRMAARFKKDPKSSPAFIHTLNGSGVAVGRLAAAILENFQTRDGSVKIPEALVPYFGAAGIS